MSPTDFDLGYFLLVLGIIVAYIFVFGFIAYADYCNAKANKETGHGSDD